MSDTYDNPCARCGTRYDGPEFVPTTNLCPNCAEAEHLTEREVRMRAVLAKVLIELRNVPNHGQELDFGLIGVEVSGHCDRQLMKALWGALGNYPLECPYCHTGGEWWDLESPDFCQHCKVHWRL